MFENITLSDRQNAEMDKVLNRLSEQGFKFRNDNEKALFVNVIKFFTLRNGSNLLTLPNFRFNDDVLVFELNVPDGKPTFEIKNLASNPKMLLNWEHNVKEIQMYMEEQFKKICKGNGTRNVHVRLVDTQNKIAMLEIVNGEIRYDIGYYTIAKLLEPYADKPTVPPEKMN